MSRDCQSERRVEIVLASNNEKKAMEMRSLLPGDFVVRTAAQAGVDMPDETGSTFAENALLKARAAAQQSGLIAVADDSGLCVDALGGAPGVRSARYAADNGRPESDEENNRLLLENLDATNDENRTARFVATVAVVSPEGEEHLFEGTVDGVVVREAAGDGGFGYDPLFRPVGYNRTMAQISADEKNSISHRGKAIRAAIPHIEALVRSGTAGSSHARTTDG